MFIGTYKTIQKNTHASETTIAKVMKSEKQIKKEEREKEWDLER